jgi:hypothetical protein
MGPSKQERLERALQWEGLSRQAFNRSDAIRFSKLAKQERRLAEAGGSVAQVFPNPGYETSLSASNRSANIEYNGPRPRE